MKDSRSKMMESMMSRPETVRLLKNALSSPIGSTSRAKAQKVFKIMNKLYGNAYDGSGGPGMIMERQESISQPSQEDYTPKNIVIFHKIPQPNITYGDRKPKVISFDGKGGPGRYDGKGGPFDGLGTTTPQETTEELMGTMLGDVRPGAATSTTPEATTTPPTGVGQLGAGFNFVSPGNNPYSPMTISDLWTPPTQPQQFPQYQPPTDTSTTQQTDQTKKPEDKFAANWLKYGGDAAGSTTGYGGEIASTIKDKPLSSLTAEEQQALQDAQIKKEGSTLDNNAYGIKDGASTHHWVTDGLAVLGNQAKDGGQFLVFKDEDTMNKAYRELLYGPSYAGLTVDQAMKKWSGYGPISTQTQENAGTQPITPTIPTKSSELEQAAQTAVGKGEGPNMFAIEQVTDPNSAFSKAFGTGGKTAAEVEAEQQKTIWDHWNIPKQEADITRLDAEGRDLAQKLKEHDQYATQTDVAISNFINNSMSTIDMSNPENQFRITTQLNYLYGIRGKENQQYIDFMKTAVDKNQTDIKDATELFNTSLTAAENDLKNATAITQEKYKMYSSALTDLYTAIDNAPSKQLSLAYAKQQILSLQAQQVANSLKNNAQTSFITQSKTLSDPILGLVDKDAVGDVVAKTGVDLVGQIKYFSATDQTILPSNVIQMYGRGVDNYLKAPDEKTPTGTARTAIVTTANKIKLAKEAMQQFTNLVYEAMISPTYPNGAQNPNYDANNPIQGNTYGPNAAIVNLGNTYAEAAASQLGNIIGGSLMKSAPQLKEAVQELAPTKSIIHWFSTTPTLQEFLDTVKSKTSGAVDPEIGTMIYNTFQQLAKTDGTQKAVQDMLVDTVQTQNRANPVILSDDAFAQNIGRAYAFTLLADIRNKGQVAGPTSTISQ